VMLLFFSCLSLVPPSWLLPPSSSPPCLHHSNSLTPFSSLPPSLPPPIPRALSLCLSLGPDPRITVKWCIPRELGGALIGKEGGREGGREGGIPGQQLCECLSSSRFMSFSRLTCSPSLPPSRRQTRRHPDAHQHRVGRPAAVGPRGGTPARQQPRAHRLCHGQEDRAGQGPGHDPGEGTPVSLPPSIPSFILVLPCYVVNITALTHTPPSLPPSFFF